jgi:hypothetical protein
MPSIKSRDNNRNISILNPILIMSFCTSTTTTTTTTTTTEEVSSLNVFQFIRNIGACAAVVNYLRKYVPAVYSRGLRNHIWHFLEISNFVL